MSSFAIRMARINARFLRTGRILLRILLDLRIPADAIGSSWQNVSDLLQVIRDAAPSAANHSLGQIAYSNGRPHGTKKRTLLVTFAVGEPFQACVG